MKHIKLILSIMWWISFILLMLGGILGLIYELLPNKSIVPDNIFNIVFYAQFVVIPVFVFISIIKGKMD